MVYWGLAGVESTCSVGSVVCSGSLRWPAIRRLRVSVSASRGNNSNATASIKKVVMAVTSAFCLPFLARLYSTDALKGRSTPGVGRVIGGTSPISSVSSSCKRFASSEASEGGSFGSENRLRRSILIACTSKPASCMTVATLSAVRFVVGRVSAPGPFWSRRLIWMTGMPSCSLICNTVDASLSLRTGVESSTM